MNRAKTEYYRHLIHDNILDQKKLFKVVKSLFKNESELSFPKYFDNSELANKIRDKDVDEVQMFPSQSQE